MTDIRAFLLAVEPYADIALATAIGVGLAVLIVHGLTK